MTTEFFTRETWRPSKKRKMQKRVKPWGGCKTAPPAFLEAAKRTQIKPGRTNRRICKATKRNGDPCRMLALEGCEVCGAHGGFRIWGSQGKLQSQGRSAAARAAMVEGRASPVPIELTRLNAYRQANQWTRIRMARAWGTEAWPRLMQQLSEDPKERIKVCV